MITIALYNLKGGVGKTTSAVNLAYLFAKSQKNTILWDWDPQGAASWYFDADQNKTKSIRLLDKGVEIGRLKKSSPFENLTIVPADLSLRHSDTAFDNISSPKRHLKKLIAAIGEDADVVIFDCPPTLSPTMEHLLGDIDLVLTPCIPTPLSIRAAEQVSEFFEKTKNPPKKIAAFFTQVDRRRKLHQELVLKPPKTLHFLKPWIAYSSKVERMSLQKTPLLSYDQSSIPSQQYTSLFRSVCRLIKPPKKG